MANEELIQRGYLLNGAICGEKFGVFECLKLGSTTVKELSKVGLVDTIPSSIVFPFSKYKPPLKPSSCKPDMVYILRRGPNVEPVAVGEMKKPTEFNTEAKRIYAVEQGLHAGAALGVNLVVVSDGETDIYVDVDKSLQTKAIVRRPETIDLNPGILQEILSEVAPAPKDLGRLAERVWQAIWHATKEEPKACLLTFVEIFLLKFLSDNLPSRTLPQMLSYYELINNDVNSFVKKHGKTQIEYYVQDIRPRIKLAFPDRYVVQDRQLLDLFGFETLVSSTSVINGFAFLRSGPTSLATFNRTFVEILGYFEDFGPLSSIDHEFKLRLYETFLKKSARQQKLGQFFTPRNVVQSMIRMAELSRLPGGSLVLDPAAGVGGFVLEPLIDPMGLPNNIRFERGVPKQRIRLLGIDVDTTTNILAKANTLIHMAEVLRDPSVTVDALNRLMSELFVLCNTNEHLGTLEYPIRDKVDVILTNPPYVTQGSRIYKEEIYTTKGARNGVDLRDYYDRCGLGLESLFSRYISGALRAGGKAFVIVPQGMLTRTEVSLKEKILSECNVIASIALPRNTFFNTPQKTFILILEKRHTPVDPRPEVFCGIVSSIGESLDARRDPLPYDNTLNEVAEAFVDFRNGRVPVSRVSNRVKVVSASEFTMSDRWDVQRFWTDDELVLIGAREPAIDRQSFIEDISLQMEQIGEELSAAKAELLNLSRGPTNKVLLSDETLFRVRRGKRVTKNDGVRHPGDVPVYSGSKIKHKPLCRVSREWAEANGYTIESSPIITVNANGFVGATFVRREECIIHDDVMIIEVVLGELDIDYIEVALRTAIAEGSFEYEAKLYSRVKQLGLEVPVTENRFDLTKQRKIAEAIKRFDGLRHKLSEVGKWANDARIK